MNKALFLDRDGVINIEKNYLYKIEDFEFMEGIFSLCKRFLDANYIIIIVTNQSGIARNMYSEQDFSILTQWMIEAFEKNNIEITKLYHCPHHPNISGTCNCRKPAPQMLLDAKKSFNIDMSNSVMIGDKERDIQAGINAGVQRNYLLSLEETDDSKATAIVHHLDEIKV